MSIPTTFNRMGLALTPPPIDEHDYLSFTATADNSSVALAVRYGTPPAVSLQYSKDKARWKTYTIGNKINLSENEKVYFRGNNASFNSSEGRYNFVTSGAVDVGGNIMSLVDKTCESTTLAPFIFALTFYNCASLNNAENLKLPSNALTSACYRGMFRGCSGLLTAPTLSATSLEVNCYRDMFSDCASLSAAPELPATTLAGNCYQSMFQGCTALTDAPELPATTLANSCYQYMFQGCTALTDAPELPATTLANSCYQYMFEGCSSLSSMNVAFTEWNYYTNAWVYNVGANGIFKCPSTLSAEYGSSRIPNGWTVVHNDYFYVEATSNGTYGSLDYHGPLEDDGNPYEVVDEEAWEEAQESIYHEAVTHWDEELQEEVVDEEEWYEDQPPIFHDAVTHLEHNPIPPYNIEYSYDLVTWQSAEFVPTSWDIFNGTCNYDGFSCTAYYNIPEINAGEKIYLRGTNTTFYDDSDPNNPSYGILNFSSSVISGGNVMSLLDPTMQQTSTPSGCFNTLFTGLTTA